MNKFQDFLGYLSGYKQLYEQTALELLEARTTIVQLRQELSETKQRITELELLLPHPSPPKITYVVQKDSDWLQAKLLCLEVIHIQLDNSYYLTNQTNFLNIIAWDWVDSLPYIKERFDCENFAIMFKAHVDLHFNLNQVAIVLDYKSKHAYNLVVYADGKVGILEPQSDALYVWPNRPETFYPLTGAVVLM